MSAFELNSNQRSLTDTMAMSPNDCAAENVELYSIDGESLHPRRVQ
jgi:hypothetical protein